MTDHPEQPRTPADLKPRAKAPASVSVLTQWIGHAV